MKELTLDETKQLLLEILIYFDDFCQKNGLKYSLAYGSLLGAVRHKGFIPWDDDIDVMMPKEDYIKLLTIYDNSGRYRLHHAKNEKDNNEKYYYPFAKLEDSETFIKFDKLKDTGGAFIDIFPMTYCYDSPIKHKRMLKSIKNNAYFISFLDRTTGGKLKNIARKCFGFLYFFPRNKIIRKAFAIEDGSKIGDNVWSFNPKRVYDKRLFDNLIRLDFENAKVLCVKDYANVLEKIYGDWKKLPPQDQRVAHHYYSLFIKENK